MHTGLLDNRFVFSCSPLFRKDKKMKTQKILSNGLIVLSFLVCNMMAWAAPMGTAFTYQGRLLDDNIAAACAVVAVVADMYRGTGIKIKRLKGQISDIRLLSQLAELTMLEVQNNRITDADIVSLTGNTSLKLLNVKSRKICDQV